jgi:uncharacterized membrane protein YidH (DUF202 family)
MTTAAPLSAQHYRTILANEWTFLAWQGMAVGLLLASIAIQCLPAVGTLSWWQVVGIGPALLAAATAWTGLRRWRKVDRAVRHPGAA